MYQRVQPTNLSMLQGNMKTLELVGAVIDHIRSLNPNINGKRPDTAHKTPNNPIFNPRYAMTRSSLLLANQLNKIPTRPSSCRGTWHITKSKELEELEAQLKTIHWSKKGMNNSTALREKAKRAATPLTGVKRKFLVVEEDLLEDYNQRSIRRSSDEEKQGKKVYFSPHTEIKYLPPSQSKSGIQKTKSSLSYVPSRLRHSSSSSACTSTNKNKNSGVLVHNTPAPVLAAKKSNTDTPATGSNILSQHESIGSALGSIKNSHLARELSSQQRSHHDADDENTSHPSGLCDSNENTIHPVKKAKYLTLHPSPVSSVFVPSLVHKTKPLPRKNVPSCAAHKTPARIPPATLIKPPNSITASSKTGGHPQSLSIFLLGEERFDESKAIARPTTPAGERSARAQQAYLARMKKARNQRAKTTSHTVFRL